MVDRSSSAIDGRPVGTGDGPEAEDGTVATEAGTLTGDAEGVACSLLAVGRVLAHPDAGRAAAGAGAAAYGTLAGDGEGEGCALFAADPVVPICRATEAIGAGAAATPVTAVIGTGMVVPPFAKDIECIGKGDPPTCLSAAVDAGMLVGLGCAGRAVAHPVPDARTVLAAGAGAGTGICLFSSAAMACFAGTRRREEAVRTTGSGAASPDAAADAGATVGCFGSGRLDTMLWVLLCIEDVEDDALAGAGVDTDLAGVPA